MSANSVELEIRRVLSEITSSAHPLDAPPDVSLDDVGVDSVGMIDLLYKLEECFSLRIHDEEVTPENFESIASLVTLVTRKCSG